MHVYEWNSYSCNNSSDIRLIATFKTEERAKEILNELRVFFKSHAVEHDGKIDEDSFEFPGVVTETAKALGKKYDYNWKSFLVWGDDCMEDDEPDLSVVGEDLILHHTYMSGFGDDIPALLKKAGAKQIMEEMGPPVLFCKLTYKDDDGLEEKLINLFSQREIEDLDEWQYPWDLVEQGGGYADEVSFVNDGKSCIFTLPLPGREIDGLKGFLEEHAQVFSLRIASEEDIHQNKNKQIYV